MSQILDQNPDLLTLGLLQPSHTVENVVVVCLTGQESHLGQEICQILIETQCAYRVHPKFQFLGWDLLEPRRGGGVKFWYKTSTKPSDHHTSPPKWPWRNNVLWTFIWISTRPNSRLSHIRFPISLKKKVELRESTEKGGIISPSSRCYHIRFPRGKDCLEQGFKRLGKFQLL